MKKIVHVQIVEPYKLLCTFNNDEERILDLANALNDVYAQNILSNKEIIQSVENW